MMNYICRFKGVYLLLSLAILIVGVSLVVRWGYEIVSIDACLDDGGKWSYVRSACEN